MAGIGIGLLYLSYSFGLWGYCLFKGYNVSFKQLFSTTWPPTTGASENPGGGMQGQESITT